MLPRRFFSLPNWKSPNEDLRAGGGRQGGRRLENRKSAFSSRSQGFYGLAAEPRMSFEGRGGAEAEFWRTEGTAPAALRGVFLRRPAVSSSFWNAIAEKVLAP